MFLCETCSNYVHVDTKIAEKNSSQSQSQSQLTCFVCLGLCQQNQEDAIAHQLLESICAAAAPYGGFANSSNRISLDQSTLLLPGDLIYRYQLACQEYGTVDTVLTADNNASEFSNALKARASSIFETCLALANNNKQSNDSSHDTFQVDEEEAGYLAIHVILSPALSRPLDLIPSYTLPRQARRKHLNIISQGGDPRENHKARVANVWPINQAVTCLPLPRSNYSLETYDNNATDGTTTTTCALTPSVAVWRRPFYIRGMYTKSRRDVSQTPFCVVERNGEKRTLGVTSVEQQILPVLERTCGGISQLNNTNMTTRNGVVYGMAKFHASGREDMDVRMLLPPPATIGNDKKITGRPFVCEITDALRMPTLEELKQVVHEINHTYDSSNNSDATPFNSRAYGQNPLGVDVAAELCYVPSSSYAQLQSETENKVKYYGCLCWSRDAYSNIDDLKRKLGLIPVKIHQKTPLRVIHRRSNIVRVRHVLFCNAERVDDHYFRLHLSTDAGTYVKEFVHGDLGRTVPSISSLLGCKTDILELDCEGIEYS